MQWLNENQCVNTQEVYINFITHDVLLLLNWCERNSAICRNLYQAFKFTIEKFKSYNQ